MASSLQHSPTFPEHHAQGLEPRRWLDGGAPGIAIENESYAEVTRLRAYQANEPNLVAGYFRRNSYLIGHANFIFNIALDKPLAKAR